MARTGQCNAEADGDDGYREDQRHKVMGMLYPALEPDRTPGIATKWVAQIPQPRRPLEADPGPRRSAARRLAR